LVVISLLLVLTGAPVFAKELSRAAATVRIVIPVAQQLVILEPVEFSFVYPWDGLERGLPLVITDVGLMQIQSNESWSLGAELLQCEGFRVYARPHNSQADWKPVNAFSSWTGPMGSHEFSWDIMVEPAGNPEPGVRHVGFVFTLSQI